MAFSAALFDLYGALVTCSMLFYLQNTSVIGNKCSRKVKVCTVVFTQPKIFFVLCSFALWMNGQKTAMASLLDDKSNLTNYITMPNMASFFDFLYRFADIFPVIG